MTAPRTSIRDLILALLAARESGATICPSEVARAAAGDAETAGASWRDLMPEVHNAVDRLLAEELVRLSWKGEPLAARAGPYRIGRRPRAGGKGFAATVAKKRSS